MIDAYQLSHLIFRYGNCTALDIERLTIRAGVSTALIGANGSGKSTLLHLLAFLDTPTTGKIDFLGSPVETFDGKQLRRLVAFLPQQPFLFRGTVEDNLHLALNIHGYKRIERNRRIDKTLNRLEIDNLKSQPVNVLSGGELQKAALARALLFEPSVLLLDEPFSYLDEDSMDLLERFIGEYCQDTNRTVIFSVHDRLRGLALATDNISLVCGKPVATQLINVFNGHCEKQVFNTGKMKIYMADDFPEGRHIAIDPREIVLSRNAIVSSMRNQFQGRVSGIAEENHNIRVTIIAGERFQVQVTHQAVESLGIRLGMEIWLSFKSNAVLVF